MSRLTHEAHGAYAPPVPARELIAHSADGARLHVEVHGPEDAPAVVLAHGWTCSTAFWAAQIRDLAADHRVIAYDQRGHGRSPASDTCSTEALADDLEAVLAATLAPGEKAVLAGHSMGGMTLMAASTRPRFREHAAAALLCSTGSTRLVEESRVLPLRAGRLRTRVTGAVLGSRAPLGPVTPVARRILKYATMGPGSSPVMVEACARIVHACPRAVRHAWSAVLATLDLEEGVRELRVPTAVIAGTVDRLTPVVHARALVAALPNCVGSTELPGLGHMTPVEAPELVTARIRELVSTYTRTAETQKAVESGEIVVEHAEIAAVTAEIEEGA
ncbi:alpha/beta fold hydrolase [Streptomyces rhizosphaerihabitans]|uniref:alpha/beta fold hydrolase n=1 Tax=Streptomyces rhizosphaerihabitans TaxID=1266770 RepID=UPI0021C0DAE3|nr:alpha/beta hydrolase [Streptomyces rhizosphaerihabitans]MCT9005485.1 alpha/beta hydrolase [Streptomyces rhizosphaerihabitans]